MSAVKRTIESSIKYYAKKYPVLVVTGPRQSGKTTMLKTMFPKYTYISLENPDLREFATLDPNGFFEYYSGNLILDEVQQTPALFSYIQTLVDASGKMGQFILSGSQNFHLMQHITQSLAGRVALFRLLPFDFTELQQANLLSNNYEEILVKGCYPAIFDREISSKVFYSNYLQTYVEKDLKQLIDVRDLKQFRNFISLCAARSGQLLNLNSLGNECGISQPTAKAWLSVLESSYIVFLLQPYHVNFNKRIVKTPKLFFYDTGLLCHLLKITNAESIQLHPLKGSLFENLIVAEAFKQNDHKYLHADFCFWRDASGHEVDLLIEHNDKLGIAEIKASATIKNEYFNGLNYFEALEGSNVKGKNLIYTGDLNQKRSHFNLVSWKQTADVLK
jgi:predicted AAA+ superfamily ATPase